MDPSPCYAVFAEYSPISKAMQPGMNIRVFNCIEARSTDQSIELDLETGEVTLPPGTYHISGFSTVVYFTGGEPAEMVQPRTPAAGGYCRLRRAEDPAEEHGPGICLGSVSTANAVPSLVETYFAASESTRIVLEHQSGSDPKDVYLQVFSGGSSLHVFARLAIRRL